MLNVTQVDLEKLKGCQDTSGQYQMEDTDLGTLILWFSVQTGIRKLMVASPQLYLTALALPSALRYAMLTLPLLPSFSAMKITDSPM
ncbi:hypothetical protein E2C01_001931 [Portunus trituberculatus]|uniref:Uncharacterized protein n=1 Tax=Portunus trituberculatus TaxID=210409 RepID=A0A5B7CI21_PORTR|nr:hypothetical protein [Portunus trituberculatus]